MKRLNTVLIALTLTAALVTWQSFTRNGNLYSNATGAPSDSQCNGCHSGSALNNSGGLLSISVAGNPSSYVPGQIYDVSITQSFTGRSKFGFAFAAKQTSNGTPRGTLATGGNSNVQLLSNYITHSSSGTSASNTKTWTFKWTAPATSVGNISLVAWGNAANNNNDLSGDFIYTTSKVLSVSTATGPAPAAAHLHVFPMPATDRLNVQLPAETSGEVTATLTGMNGQVFTLGENQVNNGTLQYTIPAQLARGIYMLQVQAGAQAFVKKVLIN